MKKPFDSITTWILLPFLLLISASLAFFFIVSLLDRQKVIDQTFEEISAEVNERVNEKLELYLTLPHLINKSNENAIELGILEFDSEDEDSAQRYFAKQLVAFRSDFEELNQLINSIYFGNKSNIFWGAEYDPEDGKFKVTFASEGTEQKFGKKEVSDIGEILDEDYTTDEDEDEDGFKPVDRPWFEPGSQEAWSPVYIDTTTKEPVITATKAISDLDGVLGVDLLFLEIEEFLEEVIQGFGENALIFITSGDDGQNESELPYLVTSSKGSAYREIESDTDEEDDLELIPAANLSNHQSLTSDIDSAERQIIAGIAENFDIKFQNSCENISNSTLTETFEVDRKKYLVRSYHLNSDNLFGLDWCIFTVIPEAVMAQKVQPNGQKVSWGIYAAIGIVTTGLAVLIASKIVRPIKILTNSVDSISSSLMLAGASPIQPHSVKHPLELSVLSNHFSEMSVSLQRTFDALSKSEKELLETNRKIENVNADLERINEAFVQFVPKNFSELLGKNISDIKLGDHTLARMAILFSDIRLFTDLSESMSAQDNFDFINRYLSRMEPAIIENHGFIDKYVGDSIMALFDNKSHGVSSENAVKAALGMLKRLSSFNTDRIEQGQPEIKVGIGIHTGNLMLGTIGGANRMDTTVISKNVNLASRLEGLTKLFGVSLIVSKETFFDINQNQREKYKSRRLGPVKPKGSSELVNIYEIFDEDNELIAESKISTKDRFEHAIELYISKEFEQALIIFSEICEICPDDTAAAFYKKCCEQQNDFNDELEK